MAVLPSPTLFKKLDAPSRDPGYVHPAEKRSGTIPMAFQITSPLDYRMCLLPHALVLHVNPSSLGENAVKKVETVQTLGGFVEFHWFDDLDELSAEASTGAFLNLYTGISSLLSRETVAWNVYRDLYDLFKNNGSVYDPFGKVVLQGKVMLLYDRGTYLGHFTSFDVEETNESPFAFKLNWGFKVEQLLLRIPSQVVGL